MSKAKSRPSKTKKPKSPESQGQAGWPQLIWEEFADITSVYRFRDFDEDTHKVPQLDIIEHVPSVNCPCVPTVDLESEKLASITGERIWIHRILEESLI
jgi:hypothetical protein